MTWTIDRATLAECARRLGTSHQALGKSLRRAQVVPGDDGKYDFASVKEAVENGKAMDKANPVGDRLDGITRKVLAEAGLRELELKVKTGELVERVAHEEANARIANVVKGELLSIQNLAPRLAMQPESKVRAILAQAGHDMSRHLAKMAPAKNE